MKIVKASLMVFLAMFLMLGVVSGAAALVIDPDTIPQWTGNNNNSMSADEIAVLLGLPLGTLDELYKQDVLGPESGDFAGSYFTEFFNDPDDPQDATITYEGGSFIEGDPIYLYVKDGRQEPAWYIFDLVALGWDGIETIYITKFWPNQGAISHVTILGGEQTQVPEPMTLLLLGFGLVGVAGARRMIKK